MSYVPGKKISDGMDKAGLLRTKTVAFGPLIDVIDDKEKMRRINERFDGTNLPDTLNPLA